MKGSLDSPGQTGTLLGRRKLLTGATLSAAGLALSPALAACSNTPQTASSSGNKSGNFPDHPTWNFVFVNHVTTNTFFVAAQYGIQDACALLNCKYQWTGSETSNVTQMVDAFNAAIAAKADGIAVALIDPTAFNDPVKRALDAGIPVVAYNADAPASSHNERLAYIGQDLFLSGQQMGERIVELVPSGDVVCFISTPGSLNLQPRIDGAKSVIQSSGKPINFVEIATGANVNERIARVEAYYLGTLMLSILKDGFTLLGVSAFTFDLILGAAILVAMILNVRLRIWREVGRQ